MQRAMLSLLAAAAVCLPGGSALAVSTVNYQVTNLTLSGGDPTFPVTTDVTFNSLSLTETFGDGTTAAVPLLDSSNTPQTSLDTSQIFLNSANFFLPDPTHGAVTSATLTGSFSTTSFDIATTFGASPTTVQVLPDFSTTLTTPGPDAFTLINAIGVDGTLYGVGTLGVNLVPEPGTLSLLSAAGVGLAASRLRARRRGK